MEDLGEKLAEILNDPESMNRVRQMAESILGGDEKSNVPAQAPALGGLSSTAVLQER